jgi:hypothetical protein
MGKRIILLDEYHPDEAIEAEVEQSSSMELILTIPYTEVELSPIFGDGLKDQAAAVWA